MTAPPPPLPPGFSVSYAVTVNVTFSSLSLASFDNATFKSEFETAYGALMDAAAGIAIGRYVTGVLMLAAL